MEIRPVGTADRDGWQSMWNAYCADQGFGVSAQASETIWRRIEDPDNPTNAMIAVGATGIPLGFINFIIHPYTWSDRLLCFLVDLYVDHSRRRQGTGQAMIAHLAAYGCSQGWLRIYWNADRSNRQARALYDRIARLSPYLSYYLDL
ncbi:GNAT family N-acetyltransferase [Mesorhizobium sp. M1156]|uniref:GNAT family N-acetyltransferase n=1 Tax=Mesorhizobium sp. M1156 TaxID=2957064 RepID=UPI0033394D47